MRAGLNLTSPTPPGHHIEGSAASADPSASQSSRDSRHRYKGSSFQKGPSEDHTAPRNSPVHKNAPAPTAPSGCQNADKHDAVAGTRNNDSTWHSANECHSLP